MATRRKKLTKLEFVALIRDLTSQGYIIEELLNDFAEKIKRVEPMGRC